MKFSITFDTETKVAKFYIEDKEADYDSFEISREVKPGEADSGKICAEYSRNRNGVEECHEIEFSPETGEVTHYQSLSSSLLNAPLNLTIDDHIDEPMTEDEKEEDMLNRIFSPKTEKEPVKETKINELLPKPEDIPQPEEGEEQKDLTSYSPVFYPKNN